MPRSDPKKSNRRTFGATTPLLPIAQGVDADAYRLCKLRLR